MTRADVREFVTSLLVFLFLIAVVLAWGIHG